MDRFEIILARHGELGVQALLENWEHFHGVSYKTPLSLRQRWAYFLSATQPQPFESKAA